MGYEVHITRKEHWSDEDGPELTLDEWESTVQSDPELELREAAEAVTPTGEIVRIETPGLSVWLA